MPLPSPSQLISAGFDEAESQEKWLDDTVLYQPYDVNQILMPDMANCLSVQAFLKLAGLPFKVEFRPNAEFMSPTGRVPFIRSGRFIIAEMNPIIEFASEKGVSLSEDLVQEEKSDMIARMSLVNTVLGNAETYVVWCDPAVASITNHRYGSIYPFPLNRILTYYKRKACKSRLLALGWLNKTLDEVYKEVDKCCYTLSVRLGDSEYFFSRPTELDALVFGHIFTILTTPLVTNRFAEIVRGYSNLTEHCTRIEKLYFPKENAMQYSTVHSNDENSEIIQDNSEI